MVNGFESFFNRGNLGCGGNRQEKFWLKTIPDLEGQASRGAMGMNVVGKFSKGEEMCPVIGLVIAENTEKLFDFLVDAFCLVLRWLHSRAEPLAEPQLAITYDSRAEPSH